MSYITSVLVAVFPLTTLFLTLLDRLTLASLLSQSPPVTMGRFPSTLVLVVALVFGANLGTCTPVFSRPPATQG